LVIVDPRSEEIVAFLPYEGASRAQAPARSSHYSRLNTKQREMIRKEVHVVPHTRTTTTTHVTVGERVPDSVELREFPERIYSEVPEMRHYRYYAPAGGGVTIVDPDANTIVDTIESSGITNLRAVCGPLFFFA